MSEKEIELLEEQQRELDDVKRIYAHCVQTVEGEDVTAGNLAKQVKDRVFEAKHT